MPTRRRRRTRRCSFVDDYGDRCRRIATVDDRLCRSHAIMLAGEMDNDDPFGELLEGVDRFFATRSRNEVVQGVGMLLNSLLGPSLARQEQQNRIHMARLIAMRERRAQTAQQPGRRPRPARPQARQQRRPAPPPRPPARPVGYPARDILGIEDDEHLTAQLIKQRHRALSQVFHPDKAGGSVTRMQKVNAAKDDLMRLLANRS